MNNANKQRKTKNVKDKRSLQENGDTKRIFHPKMGTIKDRNGKDLTEAGEIKESSQV